MIFKTLSAVINPDSGFITDGGFNPVSGFIPDGGFNRQRFKKNFDLHF